LVPVYLPIRSFGQRELADFAFSPLKPRPETERNTTRAGK